MHTKAQIHCRPPGHDGPRNFFGLELGQAHRRLGSEVTIVEAARLIGAEDPDAVEVVRAALAARIGQVNAHILRLDVLGKRVADLADLDSREFDFGTAPATGGPEEESGQPVQAPDITRLIDDLEGRLEQRTSQLSAIERPLD